MADVKWIKIVTDIFDDEKMLLIESLPKADGIIVIWFKLLCLAGKQNNSGVFMLNDKIAYSCEMLATIFRRPLNMVRLALETFEKYEMIKIIENVITIPNWEKHQSLGALERQKELTRQRVATHRQRQKLMTDSNCNAHCNVTSVTCNATDKNKIREDKEEEKNIPPNSACARVCDEDFAKKYEEFMSKHPTVLPDSCNGYIDEIDFDILDDEIKRSDILQQQTSMAWFIKQWNKIQSGYFRNYVKPTAKKYDDRGLDVLEELYKQYDEEEKQNASG